MRSNRPGHATALRDATLGPALVGHLLPGKSFQIFHDVYFRICVTFWNGTPDMHVTGALAPERSTPVM